MHDHLPSKTAFRVAVRRAVHQLMDHPKVLDDPLALAILGDQTAAELRENPTRLDRKGSGNFRAFMAARSRVAEDEIAAAVERGVRQCVILGAGLDTFAYRHPFPHLRVIEVDHPATQTWKRDLLAAAEIRVPEFASFVPVDFTKQDLAGQSRRSFPGSASFLIWSVRTRYERSAGLHHCRPAPLLCSTMQWIERS